MRRRTPLPAHGTRVRSQLGCGCSPCSADAAEYFQAWRRGERSARALVSSGPALRRVKQMEIEGFTRTMIANELGTKQLRRIGPAITRHRLRQLEALYQRRVAG